MLHQQQMASSEKSQLIYIEHGQNSRLDSNFCGSLRVFLAPPHFHTWYFRKAFWPSKALFRRSPPVSRRFIHRLWPLCLLAYITVTCFSLVTSGWSHYSCIYGNIKSKKKQQQKQKQSFDNFFKSNTLYLGLIRLFLKLFTFSGTFLLNTQIKAC